MVLKSSRYLTTSFNTIPQPHTNEQQQQEQDEFNECDIIWSYDDNNNNNPIYPIEVGSDTEGKIYTILPKSITTSVTTTTGLSAALEDPIESPTSIQRKTTSSPAVSMISSSLTRGGSDNGPGYYSYGRKFHQSAPVNVPIWPNGLGNRRTNGPGVGLGPGDEFGLGSFDENEEMEMVPPHEIVARSHSNSNRMSFSVMEGAGRTLKGRDLTTVRNAVFHKTGFL